MGDASRLEEGNTIETLETKAKALESDLECTIIANDLPRFKHDLDELRSKLREGWELWPQYDVRRGQDMIQNLEKVMDATKTRLQPRRPFRFRSAAFPSRHDIIVETAASPGGYAKLTSSVSAAIVAGEVLVDVSETNSKEGTIEVDNDVKERAVLVRGDSCKKYIKLPDGTRSVRIVGLFSCVVDAGNVDGSVCMSECTNCVLRCQCRQVRLHDCLRCVLSTRVASKPIIERCKDVRIGPLKDGGPDEGQWKDVVDMSWLRETRSTNWKPATIDDEDDSWVFNS